MMAETDGEGESERWPTHTYVPGGPNPRPVPRAGPVSPLPNEPRAALSSPAYLRGARLFNAGFYWEAHEAWEALWHAHGRRGPIADALKGLIKLAAAGVKVREHRPAGVLTHLSRAAGCLDSAHSGGASEVFGLDLAALADRSRRHLLAPPETDLPTTDPASPVLDLTIPG
jgi:hypothetical protein